MIDQTFLHCKGIGPTSQQKLFDAGFNNWQAALDNSEKLPLTEKIRPGLIKEISECARALEDENIHALVNKFKAGDQWRILGYYFDKASYFDIETSFKDNDMIVTVIGCYHKGELYHFIRGENLDDFLDLLDDIDLLVSFNGKSFDIPHILNAYHIPSIPCPHIDLRWVCFHCDYTHGLKYIEKEMGIIRPDDLKGVDGFEAVYMWHDWVNGNAESRRKLIRYCGADVVSLQLVAIKALNKYGLNIDPPPQEELWKHLE